MLRLLHLSADFPDDVSRLKPLAVANLIEASPWAEHKVVSLNRVVDPRYERAIEFDGGGLASVRYFGLPYGVGLSYWMARVAARLLKSLRDDASRPSLVHAHKLTFEGLAGAIVARELGIPYCVTVRGHTDHKVIAAKPGLRGRYREILRGAGRVFVLAPWSLKRLEQQLGLRLPSAVLLPNICRELHRPLDCDEWPRRFVSVFHFRSRRVKGIRTVLRALQQLRGRGVAAELDVIGAADANELCEMAALARQHGVEDCVRPMMAMSAAELGRCLPGYAGLILPSYPETFGLVYVEALSAGIPVVHAKSSGIDGYFADEDMALGVDHRSASEVAQAMERLIVRRRQLRTRIAAFVEGGGLDRFTATEVSTLYRRELEGLLSTTSAP